MKKFSISSQLEEKIYDLKINDNGTPSKIVTYFPLNDAEKQEIFELLGKTAEIPIEIKSIFSDEISNQEWNNSKEEIRKKFQDELFDIN